MHCNNNYTIISEITVSYDRILQEVCCEGLKFHLFLTRRCTIKSVPLKLIKKCCKFLPYSGPDNKVCFNISTTYVVNSF